jgi:outer membrane protein
LHAFELRIVEDVKQAYLDAWREKQTADFLEQDVNLLRELSEIITVMYETDRIGQQDLLRIKSEMGLAEVEVTKAQSAEVRTHAELVRAMHLPPDVPVSVEGLDGGGVFADDVTGLYQEAIAVRPELQVAWANIQRDQFRVEQARLNYYPDMNFRAGWGDMTTNRALAPTADGIGNISAGVSFNLPVQKARLNAAVFESESRVVAGVREWQSLQDATIRDVKQLHADIVNLQEQRQLYQTDILPQMEQAYEVTLGAYQVNEVAFSELIAIRRELLRLRLADLKLRVDIQKSLASLQRILARPDGEQHTNEIDD